MLGLPWRMPLKEVEMIATKDIIKMAGVSESMLYTLFNEGFLDRPKRRSGTHLIDGKPALLNHLLWNEGDDIKIVKALNKRKRAKHLARLKGKWQTEKSAVKIKSEFDAPIGWNRVNQAFNLLVSK
jgi:hypothetical protein